MCGNFDGNSNNDFTMSNGQMTSDVNTFGTSWQYGGKCGPPPVMKKHPCEEHSDRYSDAVKDCSVIKSSNFDSCRGAENLDKLYDNCLYDVCAGMNTGTMQDPGCEALKQASMLCKEATGKPVTWGHMQDKCRKYFLFYNSTSFVPGMVLGVVSGGTYPPHTPPLVNVL